MPDFPWAEGRKAEVFILPLVLIGDILSPGGSGVGRFTESSGIVPDFPWAEGRKVEVFILPLVLIGGILPPGGAGGACRLTRGGRRDETFAAPEPALAG